MVQTSGYDCAPGNGSACKNNPIWNRRFLVPKARKFAQPEERKSGLATENGSRPGAGITL
jgi:hypothetical protein